MEKLSRHQIREKAKRDLFFLATVVLGYDFVREVHQPLFDVYVQKDPTKPLHEQDTIKQRLILDSRGTFKTTSDIVDIIQWILCFPDIRILIMSGTRELASRMLKECQSHFLQNDVFRGLFPEYCPHKDEGFASEEFTVPNRTKKHLREPTVSISTIESVKAGMHYDVIKCDDLVNETNVTTRQQIEKTIEAFHYTTPILDPGGYRDVIGTRYDFSDLYGTIIDSRSPEWKIFIRPVWRKRRDGTVDIIFKRRLTRDGRLIGFNQEILEQIQRENPRLFNCQYLNNPLPTDSAYFTPELIFSHTLPFTQIPKDVRRFIAWDIAPTANYQSDYTVGAVGAYDELGRLFVIEILRGKFQPSQLVELIIGSNIRWKPIRLGIEDANGARLLDPALQARARELRTYLPIEWIPSSPKDKKPARIGSLQSLLKQDKLFFSANCSERDALLEEFCKWPAFKHDDIPDAISRLLYFQNRVEHKFADNEVEQTIIEPSFSLYGNELGAGIIG